MTRITRLVGIAVAAILLLVLALPVLAAEQADDESAESTETTVAAVSISAGEEPAVVVPPAEIEQPEQPWTARYLIPLLVVTAVVVLFGVVVGYNHSVRNRYKVVT
jgi:hypothetical protein